MAEQDRTAPSQTDTLAIVAGGGSLPFAVADAVLARGRRAAVMALRGFADPARVGAYVHEWGSVAQLGRFRRFARDHGCRDVVFIGTVMRPSLSQVRLDFGALMALPHIIASLRGGDDHLLTTVGRVFEHYGFRVLGAHQVAPEILVPAGALGRHRPSASDEADIARALSLLHAIGPSDVGQAAVVAGGHVIAVEAAEGTDQVLARVADLRRSGRVAAGRGVLVKAPKPGQDQRFDLPAIGPETVDGVARAGLTGVAVIAGQTIIAEPQQVVQKADTAHVFVVGLKPPEDQ